LINYPRNELGYRGMTAQSLKPKHVEVLVKLRMGKELSTGTITAGIMTTISV
jgi:hypothetical protein